MRLSLPGRPFEAFIFDCDGTLVDSMPLHHRAWRAAFQAHGASFDFDWDLFMLRAGMGLHDTVRELNEQFGQSLDPISVVQTQGREYDALLPEVQLIEPVVEFARQRRGQPMAVASGGQRRSVLLTLELTQLRDWFQHVICRDDVEQGKPHPESFLRCAELLGVAPERCLVFEDAEPGIDAARAAGMGWVAVDGSGRCSD